ncbi:hypothetical protein [Streptomyces sp. NPDC056105]|uniref:hypothetical protein n=1 Tax=Streptomyces sp. NPDC056105 TaxID=3345714 RepID=UPI0035E29DEF
MSWGEGSMNWSELRDLVDALPEDSATKAAAVGDEDGQRWNQQTFIQAGHYNLLLMILRVLWTAHLKGAPPDIESISPPRRAADETRTELEEANREYSEAVLNSFSPNQAGQADQDEIDHWASKIRELEAAEA